MPKSESILGRVWGRTGDGSSYDGERFPNDVIATAKMPKRNKAVKPLLEWNLAELLRVAKAAGWLPSALEYGRDEGSTKEAKIGDYAEVVRGLRNLARPARYMEDNYKKRITRRHLESVLETISAASRWLYARIERSLIERIKAEEAAEQRTAVPETHAKRQTASGTFFLLHRRPGGARR